MKYAPVLALFVGCLFVFATETPTASETETKRNDIRKLLQLAGACDNARMMMQSLVDQFRSGMPQVPDSFWEDFMSEVKDEEILELSVPGFDKYLSHSDIRELIKFYESPVGRRFAQAQPKIMQESMEAGVDWGQKLGKRVEERLREKKIKMD